ncbi:zf-HC2 domain-containing protein [Dactylosporangium aurantiacum]|uniref:Zf-HC2 domain-containing protein n=1 Tax=Dactylosporangium aurantiacum TaxID=35754 RepID=A0A9Q9IKW2_9ACTN|nr:zf-HC2 domain-containing protein [Dactylosporangium aurantiacum]MDG6101048.1 zf-HC2 domain-containing protein [Dactylosporangium aurantiacum]UWZ54913.1 zf-HC2 domain-containing protein [Dactylosporangium aurantiacum]
MGALSPPEREAYERHLADCAQCRAEVAEFGELPALLGKLDPDVAQAMTAPSWAGPSAVPATASWAGPSMASQPRVLDRARVGRRTDRRRRRWQHAGTALVAACLGVLAVIGVRAAGVGQPEFVAMQEVAASVPVTASLALEDESDGTLVRMRCAYKPSADGHGKWTYKLYVVPEHGEPEELDAWTAGAGDEYQLKAHSRYQRGDIRKLEIRKSDGTPLLVLDA